MAFISLFFVGTVIAVTAAAVFIAAVILAIVKVKKGEPVFGTPAQKRNMCLRILFFGAVIILPFNRWISLALGILWLLFMFVIK